MNTIENFIENKGYMIIEHSPNGYSNCYIAKKNSTFYFIKYINDRRRNKKAIIDILTEVSKIKHKNILNIEDILVLDENNIFCIYKHIKSQTLNKYIKSNYYHTYDKKFYRLKKILIKIAKAIDFLHKNKIIHSDIIGANILINERYNPIIIDFDFALKTKKQKNIEKNIDVLSFKTMVLQIIFEQFFIEENYKDYLENDIIQKKDFIIPRLKKCQNKHFKNCKQFIKYLFKK